MITSAPITVREATTGELAGWDDLVRRFPNHRFAHLASWIRSLEDARLGRPVYLLAERDGTVVGCMPGLLTKVGPLRLFGSPLPGNQTVGMGPVFDPALTATGELMDALVTYLEQHLGVHHVEIVSASMDDAEMRALRFRGEEMVTFRASLDPADQTRTYRAMKDSARRNVRRAERLGLEVRFEDGPEFVAEHYAQITEVYARGGNVVPFTEQRLNLFVRHMRDAGCLVALSVFLPDAQTRIATGTFTICAGEIVLWMWAHRTRARWYRPTELMTWSAMRYGMDAGCTAIDFMGRGDFKAVFGATPDDRKRRWMRSRLPLLTHARDLAHNGYRWQQAARGRLARMRLERSGVLDDAGDAHSMGEGPRQRADPLSAKEIMRALWPGRPGVSDST